MTSLNGSWLYRSFCPDKDNEPPSLLPWAPEGTVLLTTDATRKVDGKLTFPSVPGLELKITGSITPGIPGKLPEGVELTGEGARGSVNKLRGYIIADSAGPVIVGTIVAVQNDPAGRPDGTSGPFALFPAACRD